VRDADVGPVQFHSLWNQVVPHYNSNCLWHIATPMAESVPAVPKAFISYSWSSPTHQEWVLQLAIRLREDGVDVSLDKWDLKEGHDALAFMEKMVSDPAVSKVIMVLDRGYAEKADGRQGGVGRETQIISAEVYGKSDQNKFCAVLSEVDAEGRPYLPIYYKSRIYVDLSNDDAFSINYDQLLRWVFDKPAYPKPALGKPPSFVTDVNAPVLPVSSKSRRAAEALRQNSVNAVPLLREYLDTLLSSFELLRITSENDPTFDERVVQSIEAFLPYRNEFIEIIRSSRAGLMASLIWRLFNASLNVPSHCSLDRQRMCGAGAVLTSTIFVSSCGSCFCTS